MIRLICIDVDGTLVGSSGTVHPAVWHVADRVRAAGVRLAVCSGRPAFGATRAYAERLDAEGWHTFQNGASVVHLPTGRSLSVSLAPQIVAMLVERARRTDRILELYTDREYAVERDSERARQHASLLGVPFAPRPFASLAGPIVRAEWLLPHADAEAALAEPHPGLEVSPSTAPGMPDTLFVNLTPAGVHKGTAVRAVAREYGVSLDEVMFVGDGSNDAVAMQIVGCPVAMANAEPAARDTARRSVGHVDDGGLADALELALAG
ncbi:MAG TPA: HAD hydrolase family protein [Gemmatimonadaceae bacterium]|nr:HAD hydrolase family protein [Gemmatimonadaceae bacterium]